MVTHTYPANVIASARKYAALYEGKAPASAALAQWALESGYGASESGKFNYGGITAQVKDAVFPYKPGTPLEPATLCWTHEVEKGKRVSCQRWFKDFDSPDDYFAAHAKLIATSKYYAEARSYLPDVLAFIDALDPEYKAKAKDKNWRAYATSPQYAETLRSIIKRDNLLQYDAPEPVAVNTPATPNTDPYGNKFMGVLPDPAKLVDQVVPTAAITAAPVAATITRTALELPRSTVTEVMAAAPATVVEHATVATQLKLGEKSTWAGLVILIASLLADPTVQAAARPVWLAVQHGSWGGILSAAIGLGMVVSRSRSTPRTDAVLAAKRLAGIVEQPRQ